MTCAEYESLALIGMTVIFTIFSVRKFVIEDVMNFLKFLRRILPSVSVYQAQSVRSKIPLIQLFDMHCQSDDTATGF